MAGRNMARRYYEHFFAHIWRPRILGFQMVSEAVPEGIPQEYDVDYRFDDGRVKRFRILGVLVFGKDKLSGERLYADEELLREMFGPIWAEMQPI